MRFWDVGVRILDVGARFLGIGERGLSKSERFSDNGVRFWRIGVRIFGLSERFSGIGVRLSCFSARWLSPKYENYPKRLISLSNNATASTINANLCENSVINERSFIKYAKVYSYRILV